MEEAVAAEIDDAAIGVSRGGGEHEIDGEGEAGVVDVLGRHFHLQVFRMPGIHVAANIMELLADTVVR
jgi:hypothetical protein